MNCIFNEYKSKFAMNSKFKSKIHNTNHLEFANFIYIMYNYFICFYWLHYMCKNTQLWFYDLN